MRKTLQGPTGLRSLGCPHSRGNPSEGGGEGWSAQLIIVVVVIVVVLLILRLL